MASKPYQKARKKAKYLKPKPAHQAVQAAAWPKVAIVGRPNVGKSTLFNLLAKGEKAITHPTAGTTRDVRQTAASLFNRAFWLLDTAGYEQARANTKATGSGEGHKAHGMLHQPQADLPQLQSTLNTLSIAAATQADVLLFVIDGAAGVLPADRALAQNLRKLNKPILLLLNKSDLKTAESHVSEAETLGFGTPILFSAAHSSGLDDLHDHLAPLTPLAPEPEEAEDEQIAEEQMPITASKTSKSKKTSQNHPKPTPNLPQTDPEPTPNLTSTEPETTPKPPQNITTIAILGRPNVGKSTLINAILGQEKMLTGPTAGLTREAITHPFEWKEEILAIVDTPGLRRKNRVDEKDIEFLSVGQSLQAAEKADVVVLVVDASQHNVETGKWQIFEQQDAHIAQMVLNQFKPLVLCLNKWDAVTNKTACLADVEIQLKHRMHDVMHPLALPTSAKNNKGLHNLLDAIITVNAAKAKTFSTGKLNNLLNKTLAKRSPPLANGKTVSLKFIRQTGSNPPIFTFWGNRINQVSNHYQQFLKHQLAETLGLTNIPIRIFFRAQKNPYKGQKFTDKSDKKQKFKTISSTKKPNKKPS